MKCERCGTTVREEAVNPSLQIKSLGIYPTERQSLGMLPATLFTNAGGANADLASAAIALTDTEQWLTPKLLHRLPGRPINAFLALLSVGFRVSVAAAAPTSLSFALLFEDTDRRRHTLGMYSGVSQEAAMMGVSETIILASQMGEKPSTIGSWIMNGTLVLGGAASVTVTVYPTYGIVYGAP